MKIPKNTERIIEALAIELSIGKSEASRILKEVRMLRLKTFIVTKILIILKLRFIINKAMSYKIRREALFLHYETFKTKFRGVQYKLTTELDKFTNTDLNGRKLYDIQKGKIYDAENKNQFIEI